MVLYNGADGWSVVKSFKEYLSGYELFEENVIDFQYILLNVNKYSEEFLLDAENLISSVFALDRKLNKEQFLSTFKKLAKIVTKLTREEQIDFADWMRDVLSKKISSNGNEDAIGSLVESLLKGDEVSMTYAIERMIDDEKQKAILDEKKEFAEKLLSDAIDIELRTAEEILGKGIMDTEKADVLKDKAETEEKLKRERDRYNMLLEMRMNNEIPKEVFYTKREEVESKIAELERVLIQYGDIKEAAEEDVTDKLKKLNQLMEQGLELENGEFPENAIDKYIYGVKVYEDHFEWILNLQVGAEGEADEVDTPVYFKTITVTPDDQRRWFKTHPAWSKSNKYEDLKVKIYI